MDTAQIALALGAGAAMMGINTAIALDRKSKEIDRLYKCIDKLTWMVKDIDPQFEAERNIINFPDENGGIDGWAMIQIEKRKWAEGKPLYYDPLLSPEEMK